MYVDNKYLNIVLCNLNKTEFTDKVWKIGEIKMIFTKNFSIGLGDLNRKQQVCNKAILKMFEDTAGFHSDSLDNGVSQIAENGTAWIIMGWKLHVIDRPKYGTELTVETWSRCMEKAHAFREFRLLDENGNIKAVASSVWAVINIKTRGIMRIPAEMNELYGSEPRTVFDEWKLERKAKTEGFDSTSDYKIRRCDTDIIGHMHNLNYLDLAIEALPEEMFNNDELNDLTITYKNEVKVGESVSCGYYGDGDKQCFVITGNKGTAAIIKMW